MNWKHWLFVGLAAVGGFVVVTWAWAKYKATGGAPATGA